MSLRGVLLAIGIIMILAVLTPRPVAQDRSAQAAALNEIEAVTLAIKYAQIPVPAGWLVSGPTQVNAKLMSLGAAAQLKDGRPLDPVTKLGRESNRSVWLVFLRGDMTVPSADLPGKAPLPTAMYQHMAVVLDATTGELLLMSIYPSTHEVSAAATLPAVAIPGGTDGISLLMRGASADAGCPWSLTATVRRASCAT